MLFFVFGPSGSGKTTVIRQLVARGKLTYIRPHVTRKLREGEDDKLHVRRTDFDQNARRGEYVWVNDLFSTRYGTPRQEVEAALLSSAPSHILDFPIEAVAAADAITGHKAGVVILPPSADDLARRLRSAGRGERIDDALEQYARYMRFLDGVTPNWIAGTCINETVESAVQEIEAFIDRYK